MKLIIGLGNPGQKYEKTRHNVGFMSVDFLQKKIDAPEFKFNKKCKAEISKADGIILAKPQTFMNNSGEAVSKLLSFYKIEPEKIIVIHDDLDLELGKLRESKNRGSAGHNGAQSIIDGLGTKNFTRIRIGIGRPPIKIPPESYVLQKFEKEELAAIKNVFEKILEKI
ncbi:aminoacyl-tRNA hydrolase [Patescibacteria group bacterium]|nr:aminoacyl-tRNA hydrolase [Patescibacteria group bacterium]